MDHQHPLPQNAFLRIVDMTGRALMPRRQLRQQVAKGAPGHREELFQHQHPCMPGPHLPAEPGMEFHPHPSASGPSLPFYPLSGHSSGITSERPSRSSVSGSGLPVFTSHPIFSQ